MQRQQARSQEQLRHDALLRIQATPAGLLRVPALKVERFDRELGSLAAHLKGTCLDARGVGLAAPQIGVSRRVLVAELKEGQDPVVWVNPEIIQLGNLLQEGMEGCLSLDSVQMPVTRYHEVAVRAQDLKGRYRIWRLTGFAARIAQHEIDHLDGILIIDRAPTLPAAWVPRTVPSPLKARTLCGDLTA